ncbi:TolC family protein [Gaoshiqia sp. Z1-71]|uniref:TolC family protein n=1 Tax=Gaoshiqia hydrogeniformans TaxID=3290090 RepID=UPI003BF8A2E4
MNIRKTAILILLLLPWVAIKAQESRTLNECIRFALEHNLDRQVYELNEQKARIDATQSKLNLLPSLSASSSAGISFGRSVDEYSNQVINNEYFNNSNSLNSSVGIFHGFIQTNRIAWSKLQLESAKWRKISFQDELAFDILVSFYDVIYYQGLIEIAREQLQLSEFNLKKTETQVETGLKARMDLAEMQATYEKEMLNLIQSENKLETARLKLARQMNLPAGQLAGIQFENGELAVSPMSPADADSLFESFVSFSPYVKIAEAELLAAGKSVAIARGQYYPTVSLGASVSTGYYETNQDEQGKPIPFADQLQNNRSQYLGASVSIPIFNKNQARSELRKAQLSKEQAEVQLDNYRQAVYYELMNNFRDLQALFREQLQTQKQAEANELAYRVAERKYGEGMIDVIELQAVKNRLADAQNQLLLAKLQREVKNKIMDFYTGVRFWE